MIKNFLSNLNPHNWDNTILCDPRENPELQVKNIDTKDHLPFEKIDKNGLVYRHEGFAYLGVKGLRLGEFVIVGMILASVIWMLTL